jgi:hypothetical protein
MGKTYKDKPDKWRRDVQHRPKGPKNGTLNHDDKSKPRQTIPNYPWGTGGDGY